MKMYCITFRSITPAQRGYRVLRGQGMECTLKRTPKWMEERGCGYCLQIREQDVSQAVRALREGDLAFSKIYAEENGTVTEMRL